MTELVQQHQAHVPINSLTHGYIPMYADVYIHTAVAGRATLRGLFT